MTAAEKSPQLRSRSPALSALALGEPPGYTHGMMWSRSLAVALVFLLVTLTFNAYACLVPLFPGSMLDNGADCSSQHSGSAREYCDTFKIAAIKAPPAVTKLVVVQINTVFHLDASAFFPVRAVRHGSPWQHPLGCPPSDISSISPPLRI